MSTARALNRACRISSSEQLFHTVRLSWKTSQEPLPRLQKRFREAPSIVGSAVWTIFCHSLYLHIERVANKENDQRGKRVQIDENAGTVAHKGRRLHELQQLKRYRFSCSRISRIPCAVLVCAPAVKPISFYVRRARSPPGPRRPLKNCLTADKLTAKS